MNCKHLLNITKSRLGVTSDYALAKKLDLTRAAISHYQNERSLFDTTTCVKVAHAIGVDPLTIIALVELERAEKQGKQSTLNFWNEELSNMPCSDRLTA